MLRHTRISRLLCLAVLLTLPHAANVAAQPPPYIGLWGSFGSAPGKFEYPYDVSVDGAGNVYVSDANNARIQKFTGTGVYLASWGSYGAEMGSSSARPARRSTLPGMCSSPITATIASGLQQRGRVPASVRRHRQWPGPVPIG
jgi:hypothetical protein